MNTERKFELLAYAKMCFENCTNPFALVHLQKMKVNADECRDLSSLIADLINDDLDLSCGSLEAKRFLEQAEEKYKETQQ